MIIHWLILLIPLVPGIFFMLNKNDLLPAVLNIADPASLISKCRVSEVPVLIKEGVISGGMIPKIQCCVEAVRRGVNRSHILDGRIEHSVLIELLTDAGVGTMIY